MSNEKSKELSYLLRHKPEAKNITLDKEGWAPIEQLIDAGFSYDELQKIVLTDNKGRYSIKGDKIRAEQGHSTSSVDITYRKAVPPAKLYHGTPASAVNSIFIQGLLPMNRHYVHLSADPKAATSVGERRKGGTFVLTIDAHQMFLDYVNFYLSENGVWLVDTVHPKYIIASNLVNHPLHQKPIKEQK